MCVCVCVHCHVWCEWSVLADFPRHSCTRTGLMCNPSRHFKGAGGLDRRGPASGPDGSLWWKEHNPHPGITYALQRQTFYSQTFVFNCRKYWVFFVTDQNRLCFYSLFFNTSLLLLFLVCFLIIPISHHSVSPSQHASPLSPHPPFFCPPPPLALPFFAFKDLQMWH